MWSTSSPMSSPHQQERKTQRRLRLRCGHPQGVAGLGIRKTILARPSHGPCALVPCRARRQIGHQIEVSRGLRGGAGAAHSCVRGEVSAGIDCSPSHPQHSSASPQHRFSDFLLLHELLKKKISTLPATFPVPKKVVHGDAVRKKARAGKAGVRMGIRGGGE